MTGTEAHLTWKLLISVPTLYSASLLLQHFTCFLKQEKKKVFKVERSTQTSQFWLIFEGYYKKQYEGFLSYTAC